MLAYLRKSLMGISNSLTHKQNHITDDRVHQECESCCRGNQHRFRQWYGDDDHRIRLLTPPKTPARSSTCPDLVLSYNHTSSSALQSQQASPMSTETSS